MPGTDAAGTPAASREILAWAMFDFANSGFTTVVLTTIFNAYFVGVVAGNGRDTDGSATLLWSISIGLANALVLVSAPVVGAHKKRFLAVSTAGCVAATAALGLVQRLWRRRGPGDHRGWSRRHVPSRLHGQIQGGGVRVACVSEKEQARHCNTQSRT